MQPKQVGKEHQRELLDANREFRDIAWIGVRPLQMRRGPKRAKHRMGCDQFSGMPYISFADCAHATMMISDNNTWLHEVPIVQN